jgi:hypothetical protein
MVSCSNKTMKPVGSNFKKNNVSTHKYIHSASGSVAGGINRSEKSRQSLP